MIFESSSTSEVNNELRIANCKLRIANCEYVLATRYLQFLIRNS